MAEEFIWEMVWRRALGLALLELAIPVLIRGYRGIGNKILPEAAIGQLPDIRLASA